MDKFLNSSRKRDNPEVISNIEKKQKIRKYDDSYLNFGFTSTVVANVEHPQCVVCLKVMAVEINDVFHEDLLFCKTIVGETKAADLFNILDSFIIENNIVWDRCFGVCTDGARSMAGCYNGLQALVKKKAPNAVWTHCIIHREALASKIISPSLNEVLLSVIEIVNFIKTRPIKSRCFKKMCEDMGAEHTSLLYYCNSRWLSRENVLKRLTKKITSFKRKLVLWKNKMDEGALNDCFPTLYMFLHENNLNLIESIKLVFMEHLSQLIVHFQNYFPEDDQQRNWIKDPFTTDLPSELTITEQEQLIDLYSDSVSKSKFVSLSLPEFWIAMKKQYPIVANKAIRTLIPFASSYLCETGFSALAVIKSKYRGKLNTEKEMRIALSKFTPRFDDLMQQKQAQPSH
ncbi:zinc finger BED domain-containing protein 5-like [Metopolophium dirhodum]|uniref:zinc finger BED domain-containing protein 5-like n=1 Tax=Metopolophium dirhodum TaxID=44670 RepID=UPI00298F4C3C|nr:zinc finger BED domain-containing protein 5-like [Metopolophium dirhodum]